MSHYAALYRSVRRGADLNFSQHVFLRAEYRGFVYNSPTFDLPVVAGLDRVTHRVEPSVGFGYRF